MKKICRLCGKEFETKNRQSRRSVCYDDHFNTCEWCGKRFKIKDFNYPSRTCSPECRGKLRTQNAQKTSLAKYGVKNAGYTKESQEKIKQTNLQKYGAEFYFQSDTAKAHNKEVWLERYGVDNPNKNLSIREKSKQTNLKKYGDTCVFGQNSTIRKHIDETNLEKYGVSNLGGTPESLQKARDTTLTKYGKPYYTQTEEYRRKIRETSLEKYGVPHFTQSVEYKNHVKQALLSKYGVDSIMRTPVGKENLSKSVMQKYGVPWPCLLPQCQEANVSLHSKVNTRFSQSLTDHNIEHSDEYRIDNRSYDFKITDSNILVEIDPSATHNTCEGLYFPPISKEYHLNKSKLAEAHGYRCIHVFDWDNWDKIIELLSPFKTKVYARNLILKSVDATECNNFLNLHHIQNTCKGQNFAYGLYSDNTLLEVMTFGKPRYNKSYQYELLRLCTHSKYIVVGGASRLLNAFIREHDPESIISYCDNAKFKGDVYLNLGFTLQDTGIPTKVWSKGSEFVTNNLLMQRGYDQLFGTNYGKGSSNEELMLQHNWLPVYDCGQSVYVWRT